MNNEIKELIKEKEDLQKRFNSLLEAHKICDEQNMDYATRIDKAIKLLKEAGCYDEETKTFCYDIWEELPNILNTLERSDKE